MKKYIIPTAKAINITPETLIATSPGIDNGSGLGREEGEGEFTQKQGGSSLWDSWK